MGNRLAGEKSPYLLQHADNPVDWYPWGEEAFARARKEDRPVFLSIGYSACRWCHAMERECFSDAEVAALLNDTCVPIKVDREERPDLDALFMEVCCIQNGKGGWPLNLFLTPEGKPFFAATYLPKRSVGKMPGLADVTPRVKWLWTMQRDDVLRGAKNLAETLAAKIDFAPGGQIGSFQVKDAVRHLRSSFDRTWGGFGTPPKFPCAPRLLFLLEHARHDAQEREEALGMAGLTLRKMWAGGIHDHLGGGYARYVTDRQWITPHFEKTLRDQAMLLWTAAAVRELDDDVFYREFAEDIAGCVERDFASPDAAFRTAIDADSEGGEGAYYLWGEDDIRKTLPQGDAGLFCAAYAILPGGNFAHEVTGVQVGQNILYEAAAHAELARRYGLRAPEVALRLENDKKALREARTRRVPPRTDEKALMADNGLMIGALARAGRVFENRDWVLAAERAALFLQKVLPDPKGAWRRRWLAKEAAIPALPGDYAALMWGVMQLHDAAQDRQKKEWLRYAETLAEKLKENFWDRDKGGFFLSAEGDSLLFLRHKGASDDAVPSANAMAAMAFAALGRAEGGENAAKHLETADAIASCFARTAGVRPIEHISLLTASMQLKDAKGALKAEKEAEEAREAEDADANAKKAADAENISPPGSPAISPAREETSPRGRRSRFGRRGAKP
ncbi:MAG: thioredoxin domain-containing protein [Synergistaceae bacterium]|nr:thioredoxin domain-containing protein [Synergistaceae bacterium]